MMKLNLPTYQETNQIYTGTRTLVYRAIRDTPREPVIIKILRNSHPSFNELVQFRNQYIITRHLEHPAIVKPLALERYGNGYALIMPDLGAIPLSKYWQNSDQSLTNFLHIAIQLAEVLHYLSQQQIIHKDIKPSNIVIHPETSQVQLIDFSISGLLPTEQQQLVNPNVWEGTLAYISPEQTGRMNRGIDYRTDFYSLGVTFFELLTGKLPFESSDPIELVHCHIAQKAKFPRETQIPELLQEIVLKLMRKNAEERYQSALGLKHDLQQCQQQLETKGKITSFGLGMRDNSDRFLIPEKLYGREQEVNILLDAFERVTAGQTEMMLVAGFSGIGKTAVVNEVHKPIVRERGYFIKGKYDQFNRNIPFSAFVSAFRDLMSQLLGESDTNLANWKEKILSVVGDNGQVLIDVIPELELIIGKQPPASELSGSAVQNRFHLLFSKFVSIFTTADHPLVIFLDDLQWADSASLNLLKVLIIESETGYLLILGAYRDNEIFPAHPLMLTLDEIKKQDANINTITLTPLDKKDITKLVADTLLCSTEIATPLSELVAQKTGGNPFFTTQFLKGLHQENLLKLNGEQGYWQCNLSQIQQLALTDDVVEFMVGRLQKLPEATQNVLKLAACLGNRFDLAILTVVCEKTQEEVATDLWGALQEGFVIPETQTYKFFQGYQEQELEKISVNYRFLHDRVQQAAYSLISAAQKPATHYHIGQLMLTNLYQTEQDERLFDIVNHLNFGQSLINDKREQEKLAQLNLSAGQKATSATAYQAAIEYLETGISLLEKDAWVNQYNLSLSLYRHLAAAQLSHAKYEELEMTIAMALEWVSSPIDLVDFYVIQVGQFSLQGKYEEAIQAGLMGLKKLGIEIDTNNLTKQVELEFASINQSLTERSICSLLDLPTTVEPLIQATIKLLICLDQPTYITSKIELYSFVSIRAACLSIKHGNIPDSIKAYVNYGLLLVLQGQYQRSYEFADLAMQLSYKLNSKSHRSHAGFLLAAWIHPWAKPIKGAADLNYESFLAGLESGEIQYAAYNLFGNIFNRLFQGENLAAVALDIEKYELVADKVQNELVQVALATAKIFVTKLCLEQETEKGNDAMIEVEQTITRIEASQIWVSVCLYYILRMHLSCLTGNFEVGLNYLIKAKQIINYIQGFTTSSCYYYYSSLILLNLYSGMSEEEQNNAWQQIESNQQQLKIWSDSCSENFLHKYLLVEAEQCRCLDKKLEAIELYDRAIAEAQANEHIQEEALANELAAKFYLDWGKEKLVVEYMESAYYCYAQWGAKAKIQQLETKYPQFLSPILEKRETGNSHNNFTSTQSSDTVTTTNVFLDHASAIKASQAISEEIELNSLVCKLMQILIKNAGANKGILLLNYSDHWEIVTQCDCEVCHLCTISLEQTEDLPHTIINTIKRTQETLIINNFEQDNNFTTDPYFIQKQPNSILCTPILNQGKLIGILYLENNFTREAFTPERIEVINLLTAQAAISIENARFYHQLEVKVEQRTQHLQQTLEKLQQTQNQLIQTEKMSSLGQMVAGIAHEINDPITFISGDITHARGYFQDLLELLNLYQQDSSPTSAIIEDKLEEIELEFLCDDLEQIFDSMATGSERISKIILGLRNFSRLEESERKQVDIHEGLENTLMMLQHRLRGNGSCSDIAIVKNYGQLPPVNCYPSQLNQVFLSILTNAIDALTTSEGQDCPEISITTQMQNKDNIKICIADNGPGMSETVQQRIFDPFFTTKPVGQGTGLGLSISYQIVTEQHGGQLQCISQPEKGTEFIIDIPIRHPR
ncbi:trifunctional serine/threonine-protein kinase/ATP-binding protein/sensor histidine kinase [Dapis sp. BLCC M126]|uniref:trifunctional serine/threonine-protein kinase/ATP-binding protein/sensor histidine kinase n=1 Tax=Dapis sp. BLCC M126 TaxID=3400189 RepID=UPI003CEBCB4B